MYVYADLMYLDHPDRALCCLSVLFFMFYFVKFYFVCICSSFVLYFSYSFVF